MKKLIAVVLFTLMMSVAPVWAENGAYEFLDRAVAENNKNRKTVVNFLSLLSDVGDLQKNTREKFSYLLFVSNCDHFQTILFGTTAIWAQFEKNYKQDGKELAEASDAVLDTLYGIVKVVFIPSCVQIKNSLQASLIMLREERQKEPISNTIALVDEYIKIYSDLFDIKLDNQP